MRTLKKLVSCYAFESNEHCAPQPKVNGVAESSRLPSMGGVVEPAFTALNDDQVYEVLQTLFSGAIRVVAVAAVVLLSVVPAVALLQYEETVASERKRLADATTLHLCFCRRKRRYLRAGQPLLLQQTDARHLPAAAAQPVN
jgi:hypothetical protein